MQIGMNYSNKDSPFVQNNMISSISSSLSTDDAILLAILTIILVSPKRHTTEKETMPPLKLTLQATIANLLDLPQFNFIGEFDFKQR